MEAQAKEEFAKLQASLEEPGIGEELGGKSSAEKKAEASFSGRSGAREDGQEPRVWPDSSATRGMRQRLGTGRVRHLAVRHMWVQEKVRSGALVLSRIPTADNEADLGTKHLPRDRVDYLLQRLGMEDELP